MWSSRARLARCQCAPGSRTSIRRIEGVFEGNQGHGRHAGIRLQKQHVLGPTQTRVATGGSRMSTLPISRSGDSADLSRCLPDTSETDATRVTCRAISRTSAYLSKIVNSDARIKRGFHRKPGAASWRAAQCSHPTLLQQCDVQSPRPGRPVCFRRRHHSPLLTD